jgi:predicted nucleotidyltransferase
LRSAAREAGLSLNDFCARKLAAPTGGAATIGAAEVVARAALVAGDALVAVIAFGSWARHDRHDTSDVDVLVVVDRGVRLSRSLYRAWDTSPLAWDSRPVEPHFVHPPAPDRAATGFWAEIALDGVVLFERDLVMSRRLVAVRRAIVEGRLVRRIVHGQPYWTEVA